MKCCVKEMPSQTSVRNKKGHKNQLFHRISSILTPLFYNSMPIDRINMIKLFFNQFTGWFFISVTHESNYISKYIQPNGNVNQWLIRPDMDMYLNFIENG